MGCLTSAGASAGTLYTPLRMSIFSVKAST